ncbi:FUSC family protein [Goodfellowiella coeruleoviolacea]|uniref:FUSC family protein n=1 Tax=Goodfellowiella coeruleoviolacea TaxID=334858 RepID=UPI0020A40398|nr:FUSC family protein [Goodfellowiella coeruleoviolacea]
MPISDQAHRSAPHRQRIRDHLSTAVTAAPRWLATAVRRPGPERRYLVQAVKSAVAALVAWLIADRWLHLPQPFLAPYSAVFLVHWTVYRSVTNSVQQIAAVAAGVVLAAAAQHLLPDQLLALVVAVLVGTLLGRWRRFGDNGSWVALTAVLLLTWGTATQEVLLLDRLQETALGAAVGVAVNALVLPPVYLDHVRQSLQELADQVADLLRQAADAVGGHISEERVAALVHGSRRVDGLVRAADQALGWGWEGNRWNFRQGRPHQRSMTRYDHALATLRAAGPHLHEASIALGSLARGELPTVRPDPAWTAAYARLLTGLADAVEQLPSAARGDEHDLHDLLATSQERLTRLSRLRSQRPESATARSTLLLPARRLLDELRHSGVGAATAPDDDVGGDSRQAC